MGDLGRYLVLRRARFRNTPGAPADTLANEPGVHIIGASNPEIVLIETTPETAARLAQKLGEKYIVEKEILHRPAS